MKSFSSALNASHVNSFATTFEAFNNVSLNTSSISFAPPSPPGGPGGLFSSLVDYPLIDFIPTYQITVDRRLFSDFCSVADAMSEKLRQKVTSFLHPDADLWQTAERISQLTKQFVSENTTQNHYFCYGVGSSRTSLIDFINQMAMDQDMQALRAMSDSQLKQIDFLKLGKHQKLQTLEYLIQRKILCTKQKDKMGNTLMHYALQEGSLNLYRLLFLKGYQVDQGQNVEGFLPIHLAVINDRVEVLSFLDTQACPYWEMSTKVNSVLELAMIYGCLNTAAHIVRKGISVSKPNTKGYFLVHMTAFRGSGGRQAVGMDHLKPACAIENIFKMLGFLKSKGANLNEQDPHGLSIAHYVAHILATEDHTKNWDLTYKKACSQLKGLGVDLSLESNEHETCDLLFYRLSRQKRGELPKDETYQPYVAATDYELGTSD